MTEKELLVLTALLHDLGYIADLEKLHNKALKAKIKAYNGSESNQDTILSIIAKSEALAGGRCDDKAFREHISPFSLVNLADGKIGLPPKPQYISDSIHRKAGEEIVQFLNRQGDYINIENLMLFLRHIGMDINAPMASNNSTLYHHNKYTAAISLCEYIYDMHIESEDKKAVSKYAVISGGYSGTQDTLFTVSSNKAMNTMRAKSFAIELLLNDFIYHIIAELELYSTNVIYNAGGGFLLLIPNIDKFGDTLAEMLSDFNSLLFKKFSGTLYLAAAFMEVGSRQIAGLENIEGRTMGAALQRLLAEKKAKKWLGHKDIFQASTIVQEKCEICGKAISYSNVTERCEDCQELQAFGTDMSIIGGKDLYYIDKDSIKNPQLDKKKLLSLWKGSIYFGDKPMTENIVAVYKTCPFNVNHIFQAETMLRYISIPAFKTEDLLGHLKDMAIGDGNLGVLRMDVDNMGKLFSGISDMTMYSEISDRLEYFFKYKLPDLLQRELKDRRRLVKSLKSEPAVNLIYSGGDDLFLIGTWNDILEAAVFTRDEFLRYTTNPSITISGGIYLADAKAPIYHTAQLAGEEEENAKRIDADKDALGIFGKAYKWKELYEDREMSIFSLVEKILAQTHYNSSKKSLELKDFSRTLITSLVDAISYESIKNNGEENPWSMTKAYAVLNRDEHKKSHGVNAIRHYCRNGKGMRLVVPALEIVRRLTRRYE